MRGLLCLVAPFVTLAWTVIAGPEELPNPQEMKEVAPSPLPERNWSGLYFGLNAGGQFGHSEDLDRDYNVDFDGVGPDKPWGYSESGVAAGGQIGYNLQWHHLVLGPEVDVGYMNLHGRGAEPGSPGGDTIGQSDSDLFTTLRGRIGISFDKWLFYGTGGAIGVHYVTRVIDDCFTSPCGAGLIDDRRTHFDWGYTVGGGIERKLGHHWSIKAEYLFFNLADVNFSAPTFIAFTGLAPTGTTNRQAGVAGNSATVFPTGVSSPFRAETEGHIVRLGLNYNF